VPGIFSLADASYVSAAMENAGLTGIRIEPYALAQDFRSPGEWLDFLLALNLPLRLQLEGVDEDRLRETRAVATAAMAPFVQDDGHVRFTAYGYYAVAGR
jgi:hypothetical protein